MSFEIYSIKRMVEPCGDELGRDAETVTKEIEQCRENVAARGGSIIVTAIENNTHGLAGESGDATFLLAEFPEV